MIVKNKTGTVRYYRTVEYGSSKEHLFLTKKNV